MDRERASDAFTAYTSAYDVGNPRIALKLDHTYRVAGLCERIARGIGLDAHEVDLAWLLGMLHDIGRFEQVLRYDTFNDAKSVSHAALGAKILFADDGRGNPLVRSFVGDGSNDELIRNAIALHSAYQLPDGLDERTLTHCRVLRDADKLDIMGVNCLCPTRDIYGISDGEMRTSKVSPTCVDIFYQHRCLPRDVRRHPADIKLGHICLAWELVFEESRAIAREQGHLAQMLRYRWDREDTRQAFAAMREHMTRELDL